MAWADSRSDAGDIYASYINSDGTIRAGWPTDGVAICAHSGVQVTPRITGDGDGGAIIAWLDTRNGDADIYAQRIDRNGNALWTTDGVAVCIATDTQQDISIASDGSHGAWLAWEDRRNGAVNGSTFDIYGIHLDALGASPVLGTGTAICDAARNQLQPRVIRSGVGPFFFWQDEDDVGTPFIGKQLDGLMDVNPTTRPLLPFSTNFYEAVSDGAGGAAISWFDGTGLTSFQCLRINQSGTVVSGWSGGVTVAENINTVQRASMVSDGAGGTLFSWEENGDIYSQHLAANGTVAAGWAADGNVLCDESHPQLRPVMASDALGGAIVCWQDLRQGTQNALYAMRVQGDGILPTSWTTNGVRIVDVVPVDEREAAIVPDISGGAVVAWSRKNLTGDYDINAQRIDAAGVTASLTDAAPMAEPIGSLRVWPNPSSGQTVRISFASSRDGTFGVGIYDLRGRNVRRLARNTQLTAGGRQLIWDGKNNEGTPCPAGAYWVAVEGAGVKRSMRIIRLK